MAQMEAANRAFIGSRPAGVAQVRDWIRWLDSEESPHRIVGSQHLPIGAEFEPQASGDVCTHMASHWLSALVALTLGCCPPVYGLEREPLLGSSWDAGPDAYVDALQRLIDLVEQPGLTLAERRARFGGIPRATPESLFSTSLRPAEARVARFVQEEILSRTQFREDGELLNAFLHQSHVLMQAFDRLHQARLIDRTEWISAEISLCAD
jgi:hypothetical protein